ncbi:LITAF-like zinc ribbon domain-containing protein [Aspergillus pseudonomiae]|uniref:LITAF-like zinc ribbon domain-containing protein n=1 Tax=Aspergillus pseudonomiae TaxID=1506151 RepID=A0A5N6I9V5_9EURO|nr:LITAF-like zinc ribbon domain-containing protein [Aspergillus pseudonomiae]KAB8262589.1 LITAF-like zinc ribbon domain-containing protein [Aspergillus pseudonomiae]KAE8398437.1 LITAF-like zinc ribbon domain-containing protein [Aspergillus pseudonomiae]
MSEKPLSPTGRNESPEVTPTTQPPTVPAPPGEAPKVIPLTLLTNRPTIVDCPYCHARTATQTEMIVGSRATCWSCVCCIFLGPLGALIPCIMPSCKDCEHYCGSCGRVLAVVERQGNVRIVYYDSRAI